jgi:hypothetical protein
MLHGVRQRLVGLAVPVLLALAATSVGGGAVGLPPVQLADTAQNQRFVIQAFVDLLGREPSAPVAAYFTGQLDNGASRLTIVDFLLGTIEYRSVVVDRFYRDYLLRPSDPVGSSYYTNQLRAGVNQLTVKDQLISSGEYFVKHGNTNVSFVSALYRDAFGREADAAGRDFWANELTQNHIGRYALTDYFLRQPEAKSFQVQRLYLELLGRAPDPDGLAYYTELLVGGASIDGVIRPLMTSVEYFNLAQTQVLPQPPQAVNDSAVTTSGTPVVIDAAGNDTDADGNLNPASISVFGSGPAHGVASQNDPTPGKFRYSPEPGYVGSDVFFYRVCDDSVPVPLCDTGRIRIAVNALQRPPVANNDTASTNEDTATIVSVLANDTDANANINPASLAITAPASHGTAQANSDGTVTYTPAQDYTGSDAFQYHVCDTTGLCSGNATVAMNVNAVNDAPQAFGDGYSITASGFLNVGAPGVLTNDTDADNDSLTAVFVSGPTCGTLDTFNADGSFTYTAPDTPQTCTFTYKANDGQADSAEATVTINVT